MTHIDKENLLSGRRTRRVLKSAVHSLVEPSDPVGNLTRFIVNWNTLTFSILRNRHDRPYTVKMS